MNQREISNESTEEVDIEIALWIEYDNMQQITMQRIYDFEIFNRCQ